MPTWQPHYTVLLYPPPPFHSINLHVLNLSSVICAWRQNPIQNKLHIIRYEPYDQMVFHSHQDILVLPLLLVPKWLQMASLFLPYHHL